MDHGLNQASWIFAWVDFLTEDFGVPDRSTLSPIKKQGSCNALRVLRASASSLRVMILCSGVNWPRY